MNLLLVSATCHEVHRLIDTPGMQCISTDQFYSGSIGNVQVDLLITGVGIAAAAFQTGRHLTLKKYDLAINAGIAGSFAPDPGPGTVVRVIEDCFAEFGVEEGIRFVAPFTAGLADPDTLPFSGGRLIPSVFRISGQETGAGGPAGGIAIPETGERHATGLSTLDRLPGVKGTTTFTIRTRPSAIRQVMAYTGAAVETMEGAAFFYATISSGIPGIQIRAISNIVGERDHSKWKTALAIQNLYETLTNFLTELPT